MKNKMVWSARLSVLALAAIVPACGGTNNGNNIGVDSQVLWNSNAANGAQPTGTPAFWNDPNSGIGGAPNAPDPEDIITYTMPVIYILGLQHPLMTQVTFNQAPNVVLNEQRTNTILLQYRHNTYVQALGNPNPLPPSADLQDYPGLTQNARAHCKHYAVWHPTLPFPLVNVEGDNLDARLLKSQIITNAAAANGFGNPTVPAGPGTLDIVLAGHAYQTADAVAAQVIATYGGNILSNPPNVNGTLLDPNWTNLDTGFWQLGGTLETYYWEVILANSPGPNVVLPQIPNFPIFP